MENYIVSARKYRPATFSSVVGQEHITNTLKNAIKNGKLAQAFLFCGPRGVGKTTCARILAKTINCTNLTEDIEACNECDSCKSFNESASYNVFELDAASNNSVEDIRRLIEQVNVPPQGSKYKIYIIDEVHMLSTSAFNAFLKTLEEPPSYAKFILATTEKHKIIPTILSRCQIFDFKRISNDDIAKHLQYVASQEGITASTDALHVIAQKSEGCLRDALSMFDQMVTFSGNKEITYECCIENLNVLDHGYYFRFVDHFRAGDLANTLLLYQKVLDKGFDNQHFITGLSEHLRNLMVSLDPQTTSLMEVGDKAKAKYSEQAQQCHLPLLLKYLELSSEAELHYREALNKRLFIEVALMKMSQVVPCMTAPQPQKTTVAQPQPQQVPQPQRPVQQQVLQAQQQPAQPPTQQIAQQQPAAPPQPAPKTATKPPQIKLDTNNTSSFTTSINASSAALSHDEEKKNKLILSEENLFGEWMKYAEIRRLTDMEVYTAMNGRQLQFIDSGHFTVTTPSRFAEKLEKLKGPISEYFKEKTGVAELEITIEVKDEVVKKVLYTPKDKYEAMLAKNPELANIQKIFQDIDF